MIIGDEWCKFRQQDVRGYYSADLQSKTYLPLGMRLDAWSSLEEFRSKPHFSISHLSSRKYVFNAIFSESTSKSRGHLAKILRNQTDSMNTFVKIAPRGGLQM